MKRFFNNLWFNSLVLRTHEVMDRVMAFNATFNNASVISWRSVLLVEETGVSGENHRAAASHWQTLLQSTHNVSGDR
jgi:hypothetical protein